MASSTRSGKTRQRSLLDKLLLIGAINRYYRIPPVWWGVLGFAVYYCIPLALCALEGVLTSPRTGKQKLPDAIAYVAHQVSRRNVEMPYLKDLTHLLMALVISVGGAVAIAALDRFYGVYTAIADPALLNVSEGEVAAEWRRSERWFSSRVAIASFAIIAISCGYALYIDGSNDYAWWGNPSYGLAGVALAIGVSAAMFFGMHSLYLLAVAQHSLSRLITKGIHLRPFHPDGTNGFARLGNFLLLLFLLCIVCAMAAWITLWHGYLGIEAFPGIWLGALGVVIFIPWIVIQPLIHVTTEIRRAQILHLAPVERLLNSVLIKTEEQMGNADFRVSNIEELKTLRDLHSLATGIYETSVFPFNRKVAGILTIGYALQVLSLIKEVAHKFK